MSWDFDLRGETAVVTGGSRNIGLAIAEAFRSAGARVCVVGLSDREALDAAVERLDPESANAMGVLVDVAEESAVIDLFERVQRRFGPVSVLVNGAATRPHVPFQELGRESWARVLDVILTGAFLTSRELFRRLPEDRFTCKHPVTSPIGRADIWDFGAAPRPGAIDGEGRSRRPVAQLYRELVDDPRRGSRLRFKVRENTPTSAH